MPRSEPPLSQSMTVFRDGAFREVIMESEVSSADSKSVRLVPSEDEMMRTATHGGATPRRRRG